MLCCVLVPVVLGCPGQAQSQDPPSLSDSDSSRSLPQIDNARKRIQESIDLIDRSQKDAIPISELSNDQERRINSIKNRINLIKDLVKQQEQRQAEAAQKQARAASEPQQPADVEKSPSNELRNLDVTIPPIVQPKELQNAPQPENAISSTPEEYSFPAEFSTPINSLELANSLFLTGNLVEALKKYEYFMQQNSPEAENNAWAKCMMANCYRRTGDMGKANAMYRDLISLNDQSYPVTHAQWGLNQLSTWKRWQTEYEPLVSELDSLLPDQGGSDE